MPHALATVEYDLPDDELYAFDLDEWHLRRNGQPWGPIDTQRLLDLIHAGTVNRSTLVRREDEVGWTRLERVPGADAWFHDAKPEETVIDVFRERWSVTFFANLACTLPLVVLPAVYTIRDQASPRFVYWLLPLLAVEEALYWTLVFERPGRIEVTDRSVRRVVGRGVVDTVPLAEIERGVIPDPSLFDRLNGVRLVRSTTGAKLAIRRRAMRRADYERLMQALRLSL